MWPKSARLQYAYKVQVSDCKWLCSGPMNDVHCIRHSVTVVRLGRDQFVPHPSTPPTWTMLLFPQVCFSQSCRPQEGDSKENRISWRESLYFTGKKKTAGKEAYFLYSWWGNRVYPLSNAEKTLRFYIGNWAPTMEPGKAAPAAVFQFGNHVHSSGVSDDKITPS